MAANKSIETTKSMSLTKIFGLAFVCAGAVFGLTNLAIIAIKGESVPLTVISAGCNLVGCLLMMITVIREG